MAKKIERPTSFFVMPANALKSLREELQIIRGEKNAGETLVRYGYRCGEGLVKDLGIRCGKLADSTDTVILLLAETGLGKCTVKIDGESAEVTFESSLEASTVLTQMEKPVCSFTSGYLAGILSTLLNQRYNCVELNCIAAGNKNCIHKLLPTKELPPELVQLPAEKKVVVSKYELEDGTSYLVEEEIPKTSYEMLTELVSRGYRGLCITREIPDKVRKEYDLEKIPILWLSRAGKDYCIQPENLPHLYHRIINYLNLVKDERNVVLLSGIEYLILQNNFESVLKLIQLLRDHAAITGTILIIPISPGTTEKKELKLIERELTVYQKR